MSAESFKRKLTAILSADVKGYSRLMGENEAGRSTRMADLDIGAGTLRCSRVTSILS